MTERDDRRAALVALALGFVVCGAFAALAAQVYDAVSEADGIAVLDQPALNAALSLRTPALTGVVARFTELGGTVGMTVIATVAAVLLSLRRRSLEPALVAAVTAVGSVGLTVVGKSVVARSRPPFIDAVPPFESSFSFPSGHSLNSMALVGVLTYLALRQLARWWSRLLVVAVGSLFVVAIGLSRVYLGHHWLTDVLGAWMIALAWLTVVLTAHHLYRGSGRGGRRVGRRGRDTM
jgi:undecaprenyl-diphosphatase